MKSGQQIILHVEDDANDVLLVQRAFRSASSSARLLNVSDGEQATDYFTGKGHFADRQKYPLPSLILLDLKLPRRNGHEVIAWLRQQKTPLRCVPIVVLSSSNQISDVNKAYELGANSYVVKPSAFDELASLAQILSAYWLLHTEKPELRKES
jgi:CheY-like chemotaxis protein